LYIAVVVLFGFNIYMMVNFQTVSNATASEKYLSTALENVNRLILERNKLVERFGNHKDDGKQFGYDLHFFFRNSDCSSCITETYGGTKKLKEYSQINRVNLYYTSNGDIPSYDDVINYSNITLPVKKVDYDKLMNNIGVTTTPFLSITKANSPKVIDAYQPEPGNLVMKQAFFEKWRKLFSEASQVSSG
jgi:hypothetical protein